MREECERRQVLFGLLFAVLFLKHLRANKDQLTKADLHESCRAEITTKGSMLFQPGAEEIRTVMAIQLKMNKINTDILMAF